MDGPPIQCIAVLTILQCGAELRCTKPMHGMYGTTRG